jgi:hypothetical protein
MTARPPLAAEFKKNGKIQKNERFNWKTEDEDIGYLI